MATNIVNYNIQKVESAYYVEPYNPSWDKSTFDTKYKRLKDVLSQSASWSPKGGILGGAEKIIINISKEKLNEYKAAYDSAAPKYASVFVPDNSVVPDVTNPKPTPNTPTPSNPTPTNPTPDTLPNTNVPGAGSEEDGPNPTDADLAADAEQASANKKWLIIGGIVAVVLVATAIIIRKKK